MSQATVDGLLLAYVAAFLLYKAITVRKERVLGWSLAAENVAFAALLAYAVAQQAWPPLRETPWTRTLLRVGLAATVTWATVMLAREQARDRRGPPRR